ncbi:type IV secretion system protein VirD4 [Rhizobium halophytocola]|uniref:Type IV secretion system protein VirD4 n=2 Tax=Rhizobium halophytocola TaxID=735519 RepID=A0ABS4E4F0_9HYPH|nr:Ti-type conjugative transfer system protein TraG [Rhizobium halophytocola]MBP1852826.1 type IV secretion system protein VirD4 [Rhizobium halophytocola]
MAVMLGTLCAATRFEPGIAGWGHTDAVRTLFAQIDTAAPYALAAGAGVGCLFATATSHHSKRASAGVLMGGLVICLIAAFGNGLHGFDLVPDVTSHRPPHDFIDVATVFGMTMNLMAMAFAGRVLHLGKAAFPRREPRRMRGKRAIHGEACWMRSQEARTLFGRAGGIIIGENYRVDQDALAQSAFRPERSMTWGQGGRAPLLCFDGSFGSSHGLVFAGSGGFKTSSVTIPTALRWGGALIVLDPSSEVAPMTIDHRRKCGRDVYVLDPQQPATGLNVLDWIGRHGSTREQDIAAVASWIMSGEQRSGGGRDDFFRTSAQQLLTAMIADVCLSGEVPEGDRTLRQVRTHLAEPEQKLQQRLSRILESSASDFVKENVATFVNMTPETFSGVYANMTRATHWLSYPNYAALVSGSTFSTEAIARGKTDIFITIDLKTLETHAGLARVIIGGLLTAIYNRNGRQEGRALFLLDEAARLGYMPILETARDAGRKYGITLLMLYQSIGQLREAYGSQDAMSTWFESASWASFSAINDPETAHYISRRCGMTTVEVEQVSHAIQSRGSSRTRSRQLSARPLIQPHEVLRMRADEQIVFTSGNPPLRCGRAIWFRRADMIPLVGKSRFQTRR